MLEDPRNNSLRTPAPKAPVTSALELAALSLLVLASHLATHIPNPGSAPSAWLAVNVIPSVSRCTPNRFDGDELRAD